MKRIILASIVLLTLGVCAITAQKNNTSSKNGHEYVDLGLPSGTLWATCNIGADKPEAFGDYFQWGETTPHAVDSIEKKAVIDDQLKIRFNKTHDRRGFFIMEFPLNSAYAKSYRYWNRNATENKKAITKYCTKECVGPYIAGIIDHKSELDLEDDAAHIHWGGNWRTPSEAQMKELMDEKYTHKAFTTINGVDGLLITSKVNGYTENYIFLPKAGSANCIILKHGPQQYTLADFGQYWSRSLNLNLNWDAVSLSVGISFTKKDNEITPNFTRSYAFSIRPVWEEK